MLGLKFDSTENMTSFDQSVHYFSKNISRGLYCRSQVEIPSGNLRLKELLFTELPQKCLYRTRENRPTRSNEDKSPKLVENAIVSSCATSTSSIINSSPSVSCSSSNTNVKVNRRKPAKPCRSASRFDPHFRGVLFLLQTKIINGDSELIIKPLLKNYKVKKRVQRRGRSNGYHSDSPSGSDLDNSPKAYSKQTRIESYETQIKACESCDTRKTPLWRDAEDGTPLCNACGIRYKKYRIRCSKCWHIPKKDDKTYPKCVRCHAMLRLTMSRKL